MPERDRLAQLLLSKSSIRSPAGRDTIKDLETICREHSLVAYQTNLQLINGKYVCGKAIDE